MQNITFSPQSPQAESSDVVASMLSKIARILLVVSLGLVPIFFIPAVYIPFNFTKIFFVIIGIFIALVFYSLAALRAGTVEVRASAALLSVWALAAITFVAAGLSGDIRDSVFGDSYGIHTTVFVALLALIITVVSILRENKAGIMQLYMILTGSGVAIGLYHILRLFFGPEFLSFGIFTATTSTMIGSWNDLALFFGLAVLLVLIAVEQFPLTKWGKVLFGLLVLVSLLMLAVVNFFAIWVMMSIVSLVVLMYALTKSRFKKPALADSTDASNTLASIVLSIMVFIISILFVIGGSSTGQIVNSISGVSYVEVRPSFEATLNVTQAVYGENAFFGIGPNKFIDAWRLYKDPAINQTIFWKTPFEGGIGYIPTFAATTGIIGLLAWLVFLFFVIRSGVFMLFRTQGVDKFWYFIGVSSFVASVYLWGMSLIYIPGPAILILAAIFTGVLFATHATLQTKQRTMTLSIAGNKTHGFVMVALAVVVIIGSVGTLYFTGKHYSGLLTFNRAIASVQDGVAIDQVEQQISDSYQISNNDRFAREIVGIQIQKMNTILALPEPNEAQLQQFQSVVVNAVNAGQLAVDVDPTEPLNWQSLGEVYSVLAGAGVEGAAERSREAFTSAAIYDPLNPEIQLQMAQLEGRVGEFDKAKEFAGEAVRLKPNYTEAYFFLSQVDIARGDVAAAIESTSASITLEPRNPARYYQLGILHSSNGDTENAIAAFETAVALDQNYANARYFLAFAYDQIGRTEDARLQLSKVLELNPDNTDIIALLGRLEAGEPLNQVSDIPEQVSEVEATVSEDGEVLSPDDPDTPLLSPVNTVSESGDDETELFESEASASDTEEAADEGEGDLTETATESETAE